MPDRNTSNHIPEDDLVLFALQLLPDERMREARKHVDSCELCRSEIAKLQGDLAAYSMSSDIQLPPPESRDRLMRQVAKEPRSAPAESAPALAFADRTAEPVFPTRQNRGLHRNLVADAPEEREERRRPSRAPWVLAWTGWAVAAGCSFVAGLQFYQRQHIQSSLAAQQAGMDESRQQSTRAQHAVAALETLTSAEAVQMPLHPTPAARMIVAVVKPGTPPPEALVAYLPPKGALVFVASHMQPASTGKSYELWLMPAGGENPIPVGTFNPDPLGRATLMMPQLPRGVAAKDFVVTLENESGSATPTAPVLMSGLVPARPPARRAPAPVIIEEGPPQ